MRGRALGAALLVLLATGAAAQNRGLELVRYSIGDGMTSYVTTSVAQDADGFIWVGTLDGLNRFDGHAFERYRSGGTGEEALELPDDFINIGALRAGPGSTLLVGTEGGLARLDLRDGSVRVAESPASAEAAPDVLGVDIAPDGAIWAGTDAGVIHYTPSLRVARHIRARPERADGLPGDFVRTVLVDSTGAVWAGTNRGLARIDPVSGRATQVALPAETRVHDLELGADGSLLVGAWSGGLFRVDPATLRPTALPLPTRLDRDGPIPVIALYRDGETLWVGTSGHGLFELDLDRGSSRQHLAGPFGSATLPSNLVSDVLVDRTGTLWVATWGGLARQSSPVPHAWIPLERSGRALAVTALHRSGSALWVGTEEGAFSLTPPGTVRPLPGTAGLNVTSFLTRPEGSLIGTLEGGLLGLDGAPAPEIPSANVYALEPGRDGELLVGTMREGLCLAGRPASACTTPPEAPNNSVYALKTLPELGTLVGSFGGGLWVASRLSPAGAPVLDRQIALPDEPGANRILMLRARGDRDAWVGTMGGLARLHDGEVAEWIGASDGLSHPNVVCIAETPDGRTWAATSGGIVLVRQGRALPVPGLPSGTFRSGACEVGPDGRLYFGALEGLLAFDPADVRGVVQPELALVGVRGGERAIRGPAARHLQALVLPHDHSSLELRFAALDYRSAPQQLEYTLVGRDPEWVGAGDTWQARYTDLPPGTYRFQVRSVGAETVALDLPITVEPPFWATAWFRLLALLSVAGLGAFVMRTRAARRRAVVQTRQRIADDLHDDLGSQLGALAHGLEYSARRLPEAQAEAFSERAREARRIASDVRDAVWAVNAEHDSLDAFAERLESAARGLLGPRRLHFEADVPADTTLPMDPRRHLLYLCKEALYNASRHAGDAPVRVRVTADAAAVHVRIEDDGPGFDPATRGDGHGLTSMRRRASLMGADLAITSSPGEGTTLALDLPLNGRRPTASL